MNHTEIFWMGYKRKDGRKGIRNRVLVIYTVKCAPPTSLARMTLKKSDTLTTMA